MSINKNLNIDNQAMYQLPDISVNKLKQYQKFKEWVAEVQANIIMEHE